MHEQTAPLASAIDEEYQANLRSLLQESLESLFLASGVAGFGLIVLGIQFAQIRPIGLLGLPLMLFPFAPHRLLARYYPAGAWLLVSGWLAIAATLSFALPLPSAVGLLILPVALATLFIGAPAGIVTGVLANLAAVSAISSTSTISADSAVFVSATIWGLFFLAWLSRRPMETALRWSWHNYALARRQADTARDTQAELKLVVEDLAEANVQAARLNELLRVSRWAAEEAERAKAEFAANVSHELRTPLNMIIGFAEMITEAPRTYGGRLPPALLADVAAIHRNAQHLAGLINDVLDMSQVEAQRMSLAREWNALPEIIQAAASAVEPLFASRGLYLRHTVANDLPLIYCDRTRIRQVFLNLLNNAARFTEAGGVTIAASIDDRSVLVTVTDTGIGIREADLSRLFEPFRQLEGASQRGGGSGLGLNISRRFIELHGGQMGVHSQVGGGSSFWFNLPLDVAPEPASFARWVHSAWEPRRHSNLTPKPQLVPRLVVLEPYDALQGQIRRYLDAAEVVAATTPVEARTLLAATPATMLLVRGDSPDQTSAWVNEMHDAPYAIPVVACTLPAAQAGGRLGVSGQLTKPVTRAQLFKAIAALHTPVRSILLVDDDAEALHLFSRILSSGLPRYRVLQAGSGQEALDLLRARRPDLLLLDLLMPGMDGLSVLAAKNRDPRLKDIPVLIVSAQDPGGQPIVAPSLLATRSGGLSVADLLRSALAVSEILAAPRPAPDSGPEAMPGA